MAWSEISLSVTTVMAWGTSSRGVSVRVALRVARAA